VVEVMSDKDDAPTYAGLCDDIRRAQDGLRLQLICDTAKLIDEGKFDGMVRPVKE
jgi:hypothetical protein